MGVEYRYDTTGHNNGQIGSMKDWVSGEEVVYTYDTLSRLTRAETVGSQWGQSYTMDGFGNLTAQTVTKGSAPAVSGTTNRITAYGFSYNANGTMAAMPNWQGTYDKESRLVDVTQSRNGTESYEYDGAGRRIWSSNETMMFYGVDGKRLAKCQIQEVSYPAYGYTFACTGITYFLGQVVTGEGESGGWGPWGAARDRLGSVRAAPYGYYYHDQGVSGSSYFPYGQARTGGSVWATYQPSSVSGTMYAMNREYSAAYGRFLTPDPYMASGGVADPGSWNRYAYTQGDPVNCTDPSGLYLSVAGLPPATPPVTINTAEIGVARLLGLAENEHYELFLARQVGGRGGTVDRNARYPGYDLAKESISGKPDCYKLLKGNTSDVTELVKTLDAAPLSETTTGKNGPVRVSPLTDAEGAVIGYSYFYYFAYTTNGKIFLNGNYMPDPTKANIMLDDRRASFLELVSMDVGTNLSSEQLRALVFLHELSHIAGRADEGEDAEKSQAFNKLIVDKCLK